MRPHFRSLATLHCFPYHFMTCALHGTDYTVHVATVGHYVGAYQKGVLSHTSHSSFEQQSKTNRNPGKKWYDSLISPRNAVGRVERDFNAFGGVVK